MTKIAELPTLRDLAVRLHTVILDANPELVTWLWYGMPGYGWRRASRCCAASGSAWFLTGLDRATERRIAEIVRRATS